MALTSGPANSWSRSNSSRAGGGGSQRMGGNTAGCSGGNGTSSSGRHSCGLLHRAGHGQLLVPKGEQEQARTGGCAGCSGAAATSKGQTAIHQPFPYLRGTPSC